MKNQWIQTAAALALAMIMTAGLNAQSNGGRGMGPCGQGNGPGYGQAYGPGQGYGPGVGQDIEGVAFGPRMILLLDLTEEQQEQLTALRVKQYKTMKPLRAEMGELRARKNTLMSQDKIDITAFNKVIDQQTDLMNKMQKKQLSNRLSCRELLTEEQIMKLDQMRMTRGGMARGGMGAHKGYGMHPYHRGLKGQW